jgi:hypothetical protein
MPRLLCNQIYNNFVWNTEIKRTKRLDYVSPNEKTIVQVPEFALFIIICACDNMYSDNSDPDNNFGVSIQITTSPLKVNEKISKSKKTRFTANF